jgi:hypothetical protein
MKRGRFLAVTLSLTVVLVLPLLWSWGITEEGKGSSYDQQLETFARSQIERGRNIFRFDTFGDEDFWGGLLRLHEAIKGQKLGGVGPGVSPNTALSVGLNRIL